MQLSDHFSVYVIVELPCDIPQVSLMAIDPPIKLLSPGENTILSFFHYNIHHSSKIIQQSINKPDLCSIALFTILK